MTEYIERGALMQFPIRRDHYDRKNGNKHFINGIESVLEYAENLPTADVAPVVRCRDCKHARKSEDAFDWDGVTPLCECNYSRQPNRWHEYCSYGERKEGSEC